VKLFTCSVFYLVNNRLVPVDIFIVKRSTPSQVPINPQMGGGDSPRNMSFDIHYSKIFMCIFLSHYVNGKS